MRCVHRIFACTANLNRTIPTGLDKTLAHKCKLDESLNDFAKVSRNSAAKTLPTLGIVYRISCAIHQETRLTSKLSVMEDTTDCPLNWWPLHGASNLLEILAKGKHLSALRGRDRVHDLGRGCRARRRRHLAHLRVPSSRRRPRWLWLRDRRRGLPFFRGWGGTQPTALLHVGWQRLPSGLQWNAWYVNLTSPMF